MRDTLCLSIYNKFYNVYPDGRVWDIRQNRWTPIYTKKDGYQRVSIRGDIPNTYKTISLHRLVGYHWVLNPNNLPFILHQDDNPSNNHWTNLRWGTHKDNMREMSERDRSKGHLSWSHKRYLIIGPDDTIYDVNNLKNFCKKYDLDHSQMSRVMRRVKSNTQCKGFRPHPDHI